MLKVTAVTFQLYQKDQLPQWTLSKTTPGRLTATAENYKVWIIRLCTWGSGVECRKHAPVSFKPEGGGGGEKDKA